MTWPSCPSWQCASKRVCGCTPQSPASPAAVPRTLCSQMAGSSPKVPTMTTGGGSWSERGANKAGRPSPDWSLLFHRCCLPHWYFRDPPQPIRVARPWGDASPTPYLHHLCPFPFGDPRRAQGSGKSDITLSHYTHIWLSTDGCPGRYHPVTLSCLAPRSMTPSASTQKTSKGGHLWLLFPSQRVPGEGIGHLGLPNGWWGWQHLGLRFQAWLSGREVGKMKMVRVLAFLPSPALEVTD